MSKSIYQFKLCSIFLLLSSLSFLMGCEPYPESKDLQENSNSLTDKEKQKSAQGQVDYQIWQSADPATEEPNNSSAAAYRQNRVAKNKPYFYESDKLKVLLNSQKNIGQISLNGVDAEKLFQTMSVQTGRIKGNQIWNNAVVKETHYAVCFAQALIKKPDFLYYNCSIYFNYKTGALRIYKSDLRLDLATDNFIDYQSDSLNLTMEDSIPQAQVFFTGTDAKMLYNLLQVSEKPQGHSLGSMYTVKEGEHYFCQKNIINEQKNEYSCEFKILLPEGLQPPLLSPYETSEKLTAQENLDFSAETSVEDSPESDPVKAEALQENKITEETKQEPTKSGPVTELKNNPTKDSNNPIADSTKVKNIPVKKVKPEESTGKDSSVESKKSAEESQKTNSEEDSEEFEDEFQGGPL